MSRKTILSNRPFPAPSILKMTRSESVLLFSTDPVTLPRNHNDEKLGLKIDSSSDENESILESPEGIETQEFLTNCKTGQLGKRGIVADFKHNRFLKNSGIAHHSSESNFDIIRGATQDAFMIEIDRSELAKTGSPEDVQRINALTGFRKDDDIYRTKRIKYGNHNAMHEVIMEKIYALTGMTSPNTRFLVNEDHKHEDGTPEVFVTSPMVTGYYDLGSFLTDPVAKRFIDPKLHREIEELQKRIVAINEQEIVTDRDKLTRVDLMGEIYDHLPNYFHREIEKSFAASKLIANWDFANFNLNNIGCRFTINGDEIVGFSSVFVDFGNSGVIGFGGKYQELSLERANTAAKSIAQKPNDYDPSLTFTPEEQQLLEERIAQIEIEPKENETAIELRQRQTALAIQILFQDAHDNPHLSKPLKSIVFKTSHHIREAETKMEIDPRTTGFLTFSDLPRNIPFSRLFRKTLKEKTSRALEIIDGVHPRLTPANVENSVDISDPKFKPEFFLTPEEETRKYNLQNSIFLDSEIEIAFRLSLILDETIDYVVRKWDLSQEYPMIFPLPEGLPNPEKYNAQGLAQIFKDRKNSLQRLIPQEQIDRWLTNNPAQALSAEQNVKIAILEQTDLEFSIQEENSFASKFNSNLLKKESRAFQLAAEIKQEFETAVTNSTDYQKAKIELDESTKELEMQIDTISTFQELIDLASEEKKTTLMQKLEGIKTVAQRLESRTAELRIEEEQQKQQATFNFIKENCAEWKKQVRDRDLSCDLLDLSKVTRLYDLQHQAILEEAQPTNSDVILSESDRIKQNSFTHKRNCFVCKEFTKTLDTLSLGIQSRLTSSPASAWALPFSQQQRIIS